MIASSRSSLSTTRRWNTKLLTHTTHTHTKRERVRQSMIYRNRLGMEHQISKKLLFTFPYKSLQSNPHTSSPQGRYCPETRRVPGRDPVSSIPPPPPIVGSSRPLQRI